MTNENLNLTYTSTTIKVSSRDTFSSHDTTLFDTGASCGDFISTDLVAKMRLGDKVKKVKSSSVRTADGRLVPIESELEAEVSFRDTRGNVHRANISLSVLKGLSVPVIIGIESILKQFSRVCEGG